MEAVRFSLNHILLPTPCDSGTTDAKIADRYSERCFGQIETAIATTRTLIDDSHIDAACRTRHTCHSVTEIVAVRIVIGRGWIELYSVQRSHELTITMTCSTCCQAGTHTVMCCIATEAIT